jgi:AcrR family transcriptional regulator
MSSTGGALLERVLAAEDPDDAASRRILEATRDQLQRFGLHRLTMDSAAAAAGLSRPTLYRRFGSRDELVEAVIIGELRDFLTELEHRLAGLPTREWVVEGFAMTLAAARENTLLRRLLTVDQDVALPYLTIGAAPGLAVAREFLAQRIGHAQAAGEAPAFSDPEPVAEVLVRLCQSLLLTPDGQLPDGQDPGAARAFARSYLTPLVTDLLATEGPD